MNIDIRDIFKINSTAIGIDVSDDSIEIVETKKEKNKILILNKKRITIEKGVISHGKIKDKAKLKTIIRDVFAEVVLSKKDNKKIIIGVPENQVFSYYFNFGNSDKEISDELINDELEKNIPVNFNDQKIDYKINKKETGAAVNVYSFDKKILSQWREILGELNIELADYNFESLALRNTIDASEKDFYIVDIGQNLVSVSIFYNGSFLKCYSFEKGGDYLTEAIAASQGIGREEAEKIKKDIDPANWANYKLVKIINKGLQEITNEIKKIIAHAEAKNKFVINKIYLSGGSSEIKTIKEIFAEEFGGKEIVKIKYNINHKDVPAIYLKALGLTLTEKSHDLKKERVIAPIDFKFNFAGFFDYFKTKILNNRNVVIVLLILFLLGAIVFDSLYLYRSKNYKEDVSKIIESEYSNDYLETSVLVSTSTKEKINGISGRVISTIITKQGSKEELLKNLYSDAEKQLVKDEVLCRYAVNQKLIEGESIIYPLEMKWVAYKQTDLKKYLNNKIASVVGLDKSFRVEKNENTKLEIIDDEIFLTFGVNYISNAKK